VLHRPQERRRYGRVQLTPPLRGEFDSTRVTVVEVSVIGARITHEGSLPRTGSHRLRITWEEQTVSFECELVRSSVVRLAKKAGESTLYESGLRLTRALDKSEDLLRELIATHVLQAINEQIANARGLVPLAVSAYDTEKRSNKYRRCEHVEGGWRKSETTSPEQPDNGFTISAGVDPYHVEMLCRTWELCDEAGRELTKIFAQLSVSKKEGAPTRRYVP
jgi:hypothetical protein